MDNREVDLTRRKFLSGAKVLGALGAAALVGTKVEVEMPAVAVSGADQPASGGYHETDHIRRYYASMRFV